MKEGVNGRNGVAVEASEGGRLGLALRARLGGGRRKHARQTQLVIQLVILPVSRLACAQSGEEESREEG